MDEFIFGNRHIYYRINEFRPERQTIVFVHGLSGSSSAWLPYEEELRSSFNILSFDLRGHGKSEKPLSYDDYKIEEFAEDLHELTEYLNIKKFVLVSHSFGCFITLAFLKKHQDKVSKVIFLSPTSSVGKMRSAKMIAPFLSAAVSLLKRFSFSDKPGNHVDYSRFLNSGDWNIPRMIADVGNTSLHVYLYSTRQSYDFDGDDFLSEIRIPALIVHGKKDTIIAAEYGALMASKIANARLVLLDNADHILVLNQAGEVLKEIKDFVLNGTK